MANGFLAIFSAIAESDPRPFVGIPAQRFQLPVLLESTPVSNEGAWTDYMSVSDGELSQAASGPKLQSVTLSTMTMKGAGAPDYPWFPTWYSAQPFENVPGHAQMIERLEKIANLRSPFGLLLFDQHSHVTFLAMNASLRAVERQARSKEADTWYWTLQCKEWRRSRASRRAHRKVSRKPGKSLPAKHKLTATDTLTSLAREYYGVQGRPWALVIGEANGIKRWGVNTPLVKRRGVHVGSVVTIPGQTITTVTSLNSTGGFGGGGGPVG